ncbi:hypothetical protein N7454_009296 [Penicillium verhagenii]|nr:hypothetical protein N7454_009296 [Penicillium verhagenii]
MRPGRTSECPPPTTFRAPTFYQEHQTTWNHPGPRLAAMMAHFAGLVPFDPAMWILDHDLVTGMSHEYVSAWLIG